MKKVVKYGSKIENILDTIMILSICIIIFSGSNILNSYRLIAMSLILILCLIKFNRYSVIKINMINIIFSLFILYMLIGLFFTEYFQVSTSYLYAYIVSFVFVNTELSDKFYDKLITFILIGCSIFSMVTIISMVNYQFVSKNLSFMFTPTQLDFIINQEYWGVRSGLAGEISYNAIIMVVGMGIVISQIIHRQKIILKDGILLISFFVCIMNSGKRSFFFIAILAAILMFLINKIKNKLIKVINIVGISVISIFILGCIFPEVYNVFEKIGRFSTSNLLNGRETLWTYALNIFAENPIMGSGYGTYNKVITQMGFAWEADAHNSYLQILCETGSIGFILFSTFLIVVFLKTSTLIIKLSEIGVDLKLLNISFYFQLLLLIYGITGNPFHMYSQIYLYFVALALMSKFNRKISDYLSESLIF